MSYEGGAPDDQWVRSTAKFLIEKRRKPDNSLWVRVVFLDERGEPQGDWVLSVCDLYRIVKEIGDLEDGKYPNGKGRVEVADFLNHALWPDMQWDRLAKIHGLRDRR